jgi:hypothetical protein
MIDSTYSNTPDHIVCAYLWRGDASAAYTWGNGIRSLIPTDLPGGLDSGLTALAATTQSLISLFL